MYQLTDSFLLFAFEFMSEEVSTLDWVGFGETPAYCAWRSKAFELVCVTHVEQILRALGISGVKTTCLPWTSATARPGAQVDLLIERPDDATDVCEMKFTNERYAMSVQDEQDMRRKVQAFREESSTKDSLQQTLVRVHGLKRNRHSEDIAHVIDIDDLFAF